MLNIPGKIKDLFLQSWPEKNFRIHFPNGEWEDITNANLDSESVSLTESVCSEQNLRFGLCEASTLEFETIGVGNIKGCVIEASLEIDLSSLGDDVVAEYGQYYSVPYGTFTVNSCKRQKDMRIRKVMAYSNIVNEEAALSPFERYKQALEYQEAFDYTVNVQSFVYSNVKNINPGLLDFTAAECVEKKEKISGEDVAFCYVDVPLYGSAWGTTVAKDIHALYKINFEKGDGYDVASLKVYGDGLAERFIRPRVSEHRGTTQDSEMKRRYVDASYFEDYLVYPYIGVDDASGSMVLRIPTKYIKNPDAADPEEYEIYKNISICRAVPRQVVDITMSFPREKNENGGYTVKSGSLGLYDVMNAYLELTGRFGCPGRDGTYDFRTLNGDFGLYPATDIYPSEDLFPQGANATADRSVYYDLWYEEYAVRPFGKVVADYLDTDGQNQTLSYVFDAVAENVYYLKNNTILQHSTYSAGEIQELLDTYFVPNVQGVSYVPAEISMKGLPYLEAGDVIDVLTQEGGFETIIMQRTLKGILALVDNIESTGDELTEDTTDTSEKEE